MGAAAVSGEHSRASVLVKRVTLPRYEVEYREGGVALESARLIKKLRVFTLDYLFSEPMGQEIVLDLTVGGMPSTTTLLFRHVQQLPGQSVLEWWPRRQTDPDLLDLWIDDLEQSLAPKDEARPSIPPVEMQQVYELCRRALAGNPFIALGVHWTAPEEELQEAYENSMNQLLQYKNIPGLGSRVMEFLTRARDGLMAAQKRLATLEGRRESRSKLVPAVQHENARNLAASKLDVARLRGDATEYRKVKREILELDF